MRHSRNRLLCLLATFFVFLPVDAPAGQTPSNLVGYWEGKGTIWERALDDPLRKLTRRSETEFWFSLDAAGSLKGEATTTYEATLSAISWTIPPPASIDASVEGTSEKSTFNYAIVGSFADGFLSLQAAGETADRTIPGAVFDFVISASVSVPTGVGPTATPQFTVIRIPAKGWSPFQGLKAPVTKRPQGPHVAKAESRGDKFEIQWRVQQAPGYDLDTLADRLFVMLQPRLENARAK